MILTSENSKHVKFKIIMDDTVILHLIQYDTETQLGKQIQLLPSGDFLIREVYLPDSYVVDENFQKVNL